MSPRGDEIGDFSVHRYIQLDMRLLHFLSQKKNLTRHYWKTSAQDDQDEHKDDINRCFE